LITTEEEISQFEHAVKCSGIVANRKRITVVQVNIGFRCNLSCAYCHVNGGPQRTENMERAVVERLLKLLEEDPSIHTVDITGGAPELNPHFRFFAASLRKIGKRVIDRSNLTVFFEPGQQDMPSFLAHHGVDITASLPCYLEENVDALRGNGVFVKSIGALRELNKLGYGQLGSGLVLNLVYNPLGAYLAPEQSVLESEYRDHLSREFGIRFNHLLTITNMPINRYAEFLLRNRELDTYMQMLIKSYNPCAISNVMCREMISVGWDGTIYDCDFNQARNIPIKGAEHSIWTVGSFASVNDEIAFDNHCFGCTAGAGSSCGGSLFT
jgi:radical SAM/Cys-rich protein